MIGGVLGIHQFVHIGTLAMVGGMSRIDRDVPPFMIVEGHPGRLRGLNRVGLRRSGISDLDGGAQVRQLQEIWNLLYRSDRVLAAALEEASRLALMPPAKGTLPIPGGVSGSGASRTSSCPELMVRLLVSTGEVSGDLQGALLIRALLQEALDRGVDLELVALGGQRMRQAGATLLADTEAMGAIGLWEPLPFVAATLMLQARLGRWMKSHRLDGVVLIDYMGANVGLGRRIKKRYQQCCRFSITSLPRNGHSASGKGAPRA